MPIHPSDARTRRGRRALTATALAVVAVAPGLVAHADDDDRHARVTPRLEGRAVLPALTFAGPPSAGAGVLPPWPFGLTFPLPEQPVVGFSGIVEGPRPGEYLAMTDNGFGNKANSFDFRIRAYILRPDFKTVRGGSGAVEVGGFIEFSDPWHHIPFPIQDQTSARVLTGADIDPESIQRGRHGDLWIGDEFGPWLLHFDDAGRLLEPPIELPDGLLAAANPALDGRPVTVNASRGIEALAVSPNGRYLYVVLEGAVIGDAPNVRRIYELDVRRREWSRMADYRVELDANLVADAQGLDRHHLALIERDGGRGYLGTAVFRSVYEVDLRSEAPDGTLLKERVVDLTAIPDPGGVSLPPVRAGDVGLGDPFSVACESIEALRILSRRRLLLGCDNNFPNPGRNASFPDDSELITVRVR